MIESAQFSAWFSAYAPALTLYARQIVAEPDQADDVVHEAFVALLSQRRAPDDVRAWLFATVRKRALSQIRSILRRRRRETAVVRADWFESRADDLIDARAAEEALQHLASEQREVVVLRIWAQMTFAQIAELTGGSVSGSFDRYRTALCTLREVMEKPCPTHPKK